MHVKLLQRRLEVFAFLHYETFNFINGATYEGWTNNVIKNNFKIR